ncbi:MAG: PIN domain nuclease [Nitrospirae bacterium]|nr:PIN domain nuclease [Nitrospirota bacterium]
MKADRYLVDTTVWVAYLRGGDASLKDRLGALVREDRVFMSEIVLTEILRGAKSDKDYAILREDFLALPQLAVTRDVWETAWHTAYHLRKRGVTTPLTDTLIASVCIHYKCSLIHADKHFNLIAKHTDLKTVEL